MFFSTKFLEADKNNRDLNFSWSTFNCYMFLVSSQQNCKGSSVCRWTVGVWSPGVAAGAEYFPPIIAVSSANRRITLLLWGKTPRKIIHNIPCKPFGFHKIPGCKRGPAVAPRQMVGDVWNEADCQIGRTAPSTGAAESLLISAQVVRHHRESG